MHINDIDCKLQQDYGDITVSSDESEVTVEVNADETTDNATELDFEVAVTYLHTKNFLMTIY